MKAPRLIHSPVCSVALLLGLSLCLPVASAQTREEGPRLLPSNPGWRVAQTPLQSSQQKTSRSSTTQRTVRSASETDQSGYATLNTRWNGTTGSEPFVRQIQNKHPGRQVIRQAQYGQTILQDRGIEEIAPATPGEVIIEEGGPEMSTEGTFQEGPYEEIPGGAHIPYEEHIGEPWHGHPGGCHDCGQDGCSTCGPGYGYGYGYHGCHGVCGFFSSIFDVLDFGHGHLYTQNWSVFAGAHGFKSPVDIGQNGNFGFDLGTNISNPFWAELGIGYQVGWRWARSNFEGENVNGPGDDRNQHYITAGFFKRAQGCGWQGGAVYDWLSDDYYIDVSLSQLRTELSWVEPTGGEFGFAGTFGLGEDGLDNSTLTFQPMDQYLLFLRKRFHNGGEGRIFGGFTGESNGLFGAEARLPISCSLALESDFIYMSADEDRGNGTTRDEEAWSTTINLVWYPAGTATITNCNPFRSLFGVANSTRFIVDRPNQ